MADMMPRLSKDTRQPHAKALSRKGVNASIFAPLREICDLVRALTGLSSITSVDEYSCILQLENCSFQIRLTSALPFTALFVAGSLLLIQFCAEFSLTLCVQSVPFFAFAMRSAQ